MEQYGHLLTEVLEGAALVHGPQEIAGACAAGRLPVLAPYRWLCEEDPLPHSWVVTSDSIAAWVAGRLGARRLILVKSAPEHAGVDDYFEETLPAGLAWEVVVADGATWRSVA